MAAPGAFLGSWDPQPVPVLAAMLAAALYAWGVRRVTGRGRVWPARRSLAFGAGLALWLLVIVGPFGAWDDTFFWAHMVQHLVTMMVVAPLLLLGAPVLLLLQVLSRPARRRWVVPVLRSPALRVLTRPVVTWVLFAGALVGHALHRLLRRGPREPGPARVRRASAVPRRRAALLLPAGGGQPRPARADAPGQGRLAGPDDAAGEHDRVLHLRLPARALPRLRGGGASLRPRSACRPADSPAG